MRLCFLLSSFRLSGGVRVVVEYANRLSAAGHEVTLAAPAGGDDLAIAEEISPDVQVLSTGRYTAGQTGLLAKLMMSWKLAREIPAVDVLIATHTPTTAASWLARRMGKGTALLWLYQDYREMFRDRPLEDWLLRNALRWHDMALAISESSRDELRRYVPSGRVALVGEGLSQAALFYPSSHPPLIAGPAKLLFLGDMRPRKGLFDLLSAAEKIQAGGLPISLQIVSKEPCEIATSVPFDYIFRPSRVELAELYRRCTVFVSASWWESFGLPPLEAMACGAAVVTTDSRGVRTYAVHDENCLMVSPRDPNALADAIRLVLADPDLADRLRRAGPDTAARFTWPAAVERFQSALAAIDSTR